MSALADRLRSLPADTRAALSFFSRVPVSAPEGAFSLARAGGAWPLAGALLALGPALVLIVAVGLWLPPLVAALLAIAAGAALTGAMHEDGLADTADGFGGGRGREGKLAIMRDSRLGTYGAMALAVVLLLKVASLAALVPNPGAASVAIIAAAVLSRALALWHWSGTSAARDDGLAAAGGQPDAAALQVGALAGGLAALVLVILFGWGAVLALVLALGATRFLAVLAEQQIGGHTGDTIGAAQQVAEALLFVGLSASAPFLPQ